MGNFIPSCFSFFKRETPKRKNPSGGFVSNRIHASALNCWLGCISNCHQGTIFS